MHTKKILVLDNELIIAKDIAKEIAAFGCKTLIMRDEDEAVSMLRSDQIDLVVSEYKLAGGPIFNILDCIKQENLKTKVIICSSHTNFLESLVEYNISEVIYKPFNSSLGIQRIKEVLETQ